MIICTPQPTRENRPPNFALAVFAALIMIVFNIFCFKIPSTYANPTSKRVVATVLKKPSTDNTLWMVYCDHIDIDSLTLDGVGVRPSGGPYVALTLRGVHFKNLSLSFPPYSKFYRGRLTSRMNSTVDLPASQGMEKLALRSITANITLLGIHLGRWTIDAGIVPNKLLAIIHLPRITIPGFLLKKISLDKVEIGLYYIETRSIVIPAATVRYVRI